MLPRQAHGGEFANLIVQPRKTCYKVLLGERIMTLVMDSVPLGQSHYNTNYKVLWDKVIMTLIMDNLPLGQSL